MEYMLFLWRHMSWVFTLVTVGDMWHRMNAALTYFMLSGEKETYADAKLYCEAQGKQLASVNTPQEENFLISILPK